MEAKDELPHFRVRDLLLPLPLINLLLPAGILEEPLVYETLDFEADEEDVTLIGVVLLRGEEAATALSDDSLIDNCILGCCCGFVRFRFVDVVVLLEFGDDDEAAAAEAATSRGCRGSAYAFIVIT